MGAEVGRNPKGWETAVEPQKLTEKGKRVFGVEELVRCSLQIGHGPYTDTKAVLTSNASRHYPPLPSGR